MREQPILPNVTMKPKHAPARPLRKSASIAKRVAHKLFHVLNLENADNAEGCLDDLAAVLERESPNWEGYNLARTLDEEYGWPVDSFTVSGLDAAELAAVVEYNKDVEGWVKSYELKPALNAGSVVTFQSQNQTYKGTITGITEALLVYTITVPGLGRRFIRAEEDIKPL